ncbi:hypothetical protein N7489_010149 [Penicillium chrysogenum]|jgi:hypothetical protein|uniref:Kinetochore protein n=1 Tax=Penicillium chrysogenum TaxID=5076 RepID=A0ABQ8WX77_PENCH|nr:uncharacterized protein N7489_010149 [Penicillium chrysogenum]KAJ5229441.1 hypothetical protein N7489_010149 [Penicillium chrysogenum]KAJ5258846.1 hypothetical protein N7524_010402 [Penicillium chrysogenum]KAJ5282676.1 hypothetical protein N7505_000656 [Penicillium chrysogenum]KAJ6169317.1 hypothetical protein N7497_002160 [Penicillium chrysogenum]
MARPNSPDATHIPPALKPLAPYVKSRQETLQIRQALTSYLRSFIEFDDQSSDHAQSHLSLCVSTDAVTDVKRIPTDLSGLRKDYLKALAANIAARKEFALASENVASLRRQRTSPNRPSDDADLQEPGTELREYLALLRERRRHTKLQVFQNYLEEIKTRDTGSLVDVGNDGEQMLLPEVDAEAGRDSSETDLDGLVHSLERAVISARTQLDRQKQLFEKAKAQHDPRAETSGAKAKALQTTRDELVQWVEERLVGQEDPDESLLQELPPDEIEEAQRELEHRKIQITEQYATYLRARRDLLDAASRACQPVNVAQKPPSRPTNKNELAIAEMPPPNPIDVLSYTNENLVPLLKSEKSLALQKSYLSGLLSKEKSTTLRALNRLSDESHLLPEYPTPARQPRFNHAAAALNSRIQTQTSDQTPDEVVALAEAWAFASNAAAANGRDFVQQKIALGTEVAQDARQTLADVCKTLNQDLDEVMLESQESRDVSDSWASDTRSAKGMSRGGGSRIQKQPSGPWSRLNGRVGVVE